MEEGDPHGRARLHVFAQAAALAEHLLAPAAQPTADHAGLGNEDCLDAPERVVLLALGGYGEHEGRDGRAWTSWDEGGEGRSPQEVPQPDDLPQ